MIFTSGTEGASKAAVLTHANCFWNNLSLSRTLDMGSNDVVLAVLPQFHVGGWNIQPLLAWWVGATVVLERGFDPGRVLQLIAERGVTMLMGVPTQYLMLAEHPDFAHAELGSLRHAVVGGAPMPAPLLRIWHRRGVALSQGYGLTEASPNVLCLPNEDAERMVGYSGKPYPHVAVAVADPVTGEILDGAASGELLVGGPGVFAGYFRDPAATAAVLAGGWLRTGDLVERDAEGYIKVVDRLKDIYISGGENVAPAEVEAALLGHPAVAQAAVVGVEDARWGESGMGFVVVRPGMATDEQELLEHCASQLARFKVPARIELVPALPRTALNKVLRAKLRQDLAGRGSDGRGTGMSAAPRTARGTRTRAKLLEAAESVFASVGYHEASIVKITEAAGVGLGTFYLYFDGKQAIFDEVVEDLNRRVRHAMTDAAKSAGTRLEAERAGFRAFFRFTAITPPYTGSSGRPSSSRQAPCGCTTPGSSTATSRA